MPEAEWLAGQIAAGMAHAGRLGQFVKGVENLIADAVGGIGVLKLNRVVVPNFVQFNASSQAIRKPLVACLCGTPRSFASFAHTLDRREFPRPGRVDRGRFEFSFALH